MTRPWRGLFWTSVAVSVPAAVNALINARAGQLEQPLPGEVGYYDWVYGRVAYYRMGRGSPVVLVHNPNMGASAWEWRKVFPALANHHTVYALDLLGFGLSDKPNVGYSGPLFADLVNDFMQDVIGQRAAAIGSGLGAAYLVNVAVRRPEIVERLVLINPTGTTKSMSVPAEQATWGILRLPVLGTSVYYAMASRQNLEQELRSHIYYDKDMVTQDVVSVLYTSAHQVGAQYAAAAFLSGRLDLPMRLAFSSLTQPVLLLWGRDAFYTPVIDATDLVYRHPQARLEILDACGQLPQDEKAGEVLTHVSRFLREAAPGEMAA